ncbi:hypothetical protein UFOVP594_20 [uncultured Caudovirales phage]|uniref:Uncharacterized protein n=1 Tax=uncultured Caudovirales phage TaxID=2100421 RepID=A0A6J5N2N5_9CAUD|nr:hypothetical protein UFOVP594_20 [uncultured Caudovirales phage]
MIPNSKNTMMDSTKVNNKTKYFFPKANPPQTVEAESVEEATKLLTEKQTKTK